MPRTLPAALTTAMDSGTYEPYLRVILNDTASDPAVHTVQPLSFSLRSMSATVTIAKPSNDVDTMSYFRIERGAVVSGTPSTISSVWFKTMELTYNGKFVTITGFVLDDSYRTVAANGTFQDVLEGVIALVDPTSPTFTYEGVAASAWRLLTFYPLDEVPKFTRASDLISILKQKYLAFVTENGWDGTNNDFFLFCGPYPRTEDYTFTDVLFNGNGHTENRRLIYTDENGEIHDQGATTLPIHNMGYLEAGSAFPYTTTLNSYVGSTSSKLPVHLKRRTGDNASTVGDGSSLNEFSGRIVVTEVFDTKSTPSWYQIIEPLIWFSGNEGNVQPGLETLMKWRPTPGSQPGDKSGTTKFEPVVTGRFQGILDANDNNIQAAMEKIDRHTHSLPVPETSALGVYGVASPGGTSTFVGTINGTPSGTSVVYNVTSGTEAAMVPSSLTAQAKMRLYNTTRGTNALIYDCNTGTNTITLTATVPSGWANGDTITIASQTVSGDGFGWCDLEFTSGPMGHSALFITLVENSATVGHAARVHPFESYSSSKSIVSIAYSASLNSFTFGLVKLNSNIITLSWTGTPAAIVIREAGYIP